MDGVTSLLSRVCFPLAHPILLRDAPHSCRTQSSGGGRLPCPRGQVGTFPSPGHGLWSFVTSSQSDCQACCLALQDRNTHDLPHGPVSIFQMRCTLRVERSARESRWCHPATEPTHSDIYPTLCVQLHAPKTRIMFHAQLV